MAAPLQQVNRCYGFQTKWELDAIMASRTTISEIQAVEGMPDVRWFLKWNYSHADENVQLYLNIECEEEVSYTTYLRFFRTPEKVHSTLTGTSIGQKEILLEQVPIFDFQSYAASGKLIIRVDGYFSYTSKEKKSNDFDSAFKWGLRLKECFPKDFDIVVDGNVIQIHKLVVAAESPVFAKMFESNFKEAAENKVTITDAKHETVQAAIDYCYRQNISDFLQDLTNSINLLFFCDKYDFQTLKPQLEAHLSSKYLSKENVSLLASTADQTNALRLRHACMDFLCDLLKNGEGLSAEMIASLDAKFKDDFLFKIFN